VRILFEIALCLIIICAAWSLWKATGHIWFTALPRDEDTDLYLVLSVSGDCDDLQQTLRNLRTLDDKARLNSTIVIHDNGITEEGKKAVEILTRDGSVLFAQHDLINFSDIQ